MAFSSLSLNGARFPHRFQLAFEPRYSFLHTPAVDFQLRFTRAACADPASLARQVMPHPSEARQKILQLSELDLQSAFSAACPLREDVEDQLRSVEHLARKQVFQVPSLRWRKFIIKNHRRYLLILARLLDGFRFAAADVVRGGRLLQFLRDCIYDIGSRRIGQLAQLIEGIVQVPFGDALLLQPDEKGTLP